MSTTAAAPITKNKNLLRKQKKMQEESITITYTLKVTKDRIDEDSTDLTWRDNVWKSLLMMKNVDDEVIIDSGSYMNETLKEFAKTTAQDVNMAFVAEAVTRAMLSPTFKELNQKKSQILRMSSKIPEVIVS